MSKIRDIVLGAVVMLSLVATCLGVLGYYVSEGLS
jgi:hypothetical protein